MGEAINTTFRHLDDEEVSGEEFNYDSEQEFEASCREMAAAFGDPIEDDSEHFDPDRLTWFIRFVEKGVHIHICGEWIWDENETLQLKWTYAAPKGQRVAARTHIKARLAEIRAENASADAPQPEAEAEPTVIDHKEKSMSKPVAIAEIVRTKGTIEIPESMTYKDAANLLLKKAADEEQVVEYYRDFPTTLPLDGAVALKKVLDAMFSGLAGTSATPGMFGPDLPKTVSVDVGPHGQKVDAPWGLYKLPKGIELNTHGNYDKQRKFFHFRLFGKTQKQHLKVVDEISEALRKELAANSIYRGKALRIKFSDDDGKVFEGSPVIDFVDLSQYDESQAIFGKDIAEEIGALIYGPMSSKSAKKIGVLLAGIPGVGKTLVMAIAARKAQQAGRTVIYTEARDFTIALRFAAAYQGETGAVVVSEDIDRVLAGSRDADIDSIYNAMDGPDTKHTNVSVLLTTNDLGVIPDPFLRPGRVRQTLEIPAPTEEAVFNLLCYYGRDKITVESNEELRPVAKRLTGRIPAVIADVVTRAQDIAEFRGRMVATLADVEVAERSMRKQLALLDARVAKPVLSELEKAATILVKGLMPKSETLALEDGLTVPGNGHSPDLHQLTD